MTGFNWIRDLVSCFYQCYANVCNRNLESYNSCLSLIPSKNRLFVNNVQLSEPVLNRFLIYCQAADLKKELCENCLRLSL